MTLFNAEAQTRIAALAQEIGAEAAALLAVAEVESAGKIGEKAAPSVPVFLFEQHKFWKNLPAGLRDKAVAAGLARRIWAPRVQYQGQNTSAGKLEILRKARAIHEEAANASCSWGVGQVMGEHAERLGFASATAMVAAMVGGGVAAQVDVMARFIKADRNLIRALRNKDWPAFAKGYNGAGYKQNHYDDKMEAAYERWARQSRPARFADVPAEDAAPEPITDKHQVELVQGWLRNLGYPEVGTPNGVIGTYTKGAIAAYRSAKGLPPGDWIDKDLILTLAMDKEPRQIAPERANADTAKVQAVAPEARPTWCNKVWSFAIWVGSGVAAIAQGVGANIQSAKEYIAPVQDMLSDVPSWVWFAAAAGIAFYIWQSSRRAEAAITEAVQTGARR